MTSASPVTTVIQCYAFKNGETFNKSGNLESHLCKLGSDACYKSAVTGL